MCLVWYVIEDSSWKDDRRVLVVLGETVQWTAGVSDLPGREELAVIAAPGKIIIPETV
jgi:hypothetical protein